MPSIWPYSNTIHFNLFSIQAELCSSIGLEMATKNKKRFMEALLKLVILQYIGLYSGLRV